MNMTVPLKHHAPPPLQQQPAVGCGTLPCISAPSAAARRGTAAQAIKAKKGRCSIPYLRRTFSQVGTVV
jgi:hypothetical protein